ncbi:hypothetical protein BD410DRAFT_709301 [Rickenella mellea]|uniref:Uncharacterized protein n=1 Tax=Rickenella mellea TaxID=50990 RepID=A0A4R5XFS4_9AGAM|nr:hypothetical protein BD410DRAFT_709301 [Rickenella mellea]
MGLDDMIIVNDFSFCLDHGSEYCHICGCDYRTVNNFQIEGELSATTYILTTCTIQRRQPINAFDLGAVRKGRSETYKCKNHRAVDCSNCFDWVGIVMAEARQAAKDSKWLEKRKKYLDACD